MHIAAKRVGDGIELPKSNIISAVYLCLPLFSNTKRAAKTYILRKSFLKTTGEYIIFRVLQRIRKIERPGYIKICKQTGVISYICSFGIVLIFGITLIRRLPRF